MSWTTASPMNDCRRGHRQNREGLDTPSRFARRHSTNGEGQQKKGGSVHRDEVDQLFDPPEQRRLEVVVRTDLAQQVLPRPGDVG